METQTAISCRHVASPDHPDAGCRFLPLVRGPVTIQGVRDPMRGPGPCGGPVSFGGPEPRLLAHEFLPPPGHVVSPDLSQLRNCPGRCWENRIPDRRGPAVWM